MSFWLPQYKHQYVTWFVKNKGYSRDKLNRLSERQLFNMYCKVRGEE